MASGSHSAVQSSCMSVYRFDIAKGLTTGACYELGMGNHAGAHMTLICYTWNSHSNSLGDLAVQNQTVKQIDRIHDSEVSSLFYTPLILDCARGWNAAH